MLISLNRTLRVHRRRLALVAAVVAITAGVLTAHSALASEHMGMKASICLAVLDTGLVAAGFALAAGTRASIALPRMPSVVAAPVSLVRAQPQPRARAGPVFLQVWRR